MSLFVPLGRISAIHIGHISWWSILRKYARPSKIELNGAFSSLRASLTASVDFASLIAHSIRSIAMYPKALRADGALL